MSRSLLRLLLSLLVAGIATAVAATAVASPGSGPRAQKPARRSVELSAPRAASPLYRAPNAGPGDQVTRCIRIAYRAAAPLDLRLYTRSALGPLARYLELSVAAGVAREAPFPSCAGFRVVRRLYEGTLAQFAAHRRSFATGLLARPERLGQAAKSGALVYRITLRLPDDVPENAARSSTGAHAFSWEARERDA